MLRVTQYYGRFNDVRGQLTGLPAWARALVGIAAIPGIALLLLSILALAVSLLALLLLTVPVYTLLKRLTATVGGGSPVSPERTQAEPSPGVKRVEATVVEAPVVE
jgi:hypothetical protein